MNSRAERFYNSITERDTLLQRDQIDMFAYFLQIEEEYSVLSLKDIRECFELCDLSVPARLSAHLSEGAKGKSPRYIKTKNGYRLEKSYRECLSQKLGDDRLERQTSVELRNLEKNFPEGSELRFFEETVACFEAGANRAAIVMCWNLTLCRLYEYIFQHKLSEFNAALATNKDKSVKVSKIENRSDFSDIPERAFLLLCRQARIISGDVKKILDQRIEIRNTAAHPSDIELSKMKTIDFIEDLTRNVIQKFF
ncbi:hypothetical protein ACFOW6_17370 [Fodinicurvata halophila]|uniref:DUF4145 domain-containing protein n=1 Tax=Fodinicurvata halophila TaxID=1419723 RepID=A0ABV8URD8_9PROT